MPETDMLWADFLAAQAAAGAADIAPGGPAIPMPSNPHAGFVAPLTDLGVIAASGDDAENFLHNQLTNDVLGLEPVDARLAGYCSPKGRLLATLLLWKTGDEVLLVLPRSTLAGVLKRLQMFVLRSRVKLSDASERIAFIGIAAPGAALPDWPARAWQRSGEPESSLIRVPDAVGLQRCMWAGAPSLAAGVWQQAGLPPAPASLWRWTDIMAGLPQVLEATREQFVPQMINFELVGGVNFRKGCYPGQEVVARSQYLGKLKRRMLLATTDDRGAGPGIEIFSETDPSQPCGMVVNAEVGPDGRMACLAELKLELAGSRLFLREGGPPLVPGELPYPLVTAE